MLGRSWGLRDGDGKGYCESVLELLVSTELTDTQTFLQEERDIPPTRRRTPVQTQIHL